MRQQIRSKQVFESILMVLVCVVPLKVLTNLERVGSRKGSSICR